MRPPRIRITTGTLLVVVLIVAVNCAVARQYLPTLRDSLFWYALHHPFHLMLRMLPLLNAAAIGILCLLARSLHFFRRERTPGTRVRLPGFTYFNVHFVALCGFTGLVMPGCLDGYCEFLEPLLNFSEKLLSHCLSETTNQDLCLSLKWIELAVFFSGPPLLISWIGGLVAQRYVSRLPRPRIIGLTVLVSLGFAITAMAVAVTPQPFREYHAEVNLDFQVVDSDSGNPIPASFLLITNAFSPRSGLTRALTDSEGRARLSPELPIFGERNLFRNMGTIETWGEWLEVSAPGYRTRRTSLVEVLGPNLDSEHPRLGRVALVRGPATDDSFLDVAGEYSGIQIERDGRFAYEIRGGMCGFPPMRMEFGYLTRIGDEFVLKPIRKPGREPDPSMSGTYRLISWGEHLDFCSTDEDTIYQVCRARLRLIDQPTLSYWGHQIKSDSEKPPPGIPRLPLRYWVGYAKYELDPWSHFWSLNRAVGSLIARNFPSLATGEP